LLPVELLPFLHAIYHTGTQDGGRLPAWQMARRAGRARFAHDPLARQYADDFVPVSEAEIASASLSPGSIMERIEGFAAALAAAVFGKVTAARRW
jgi:threonine dehydratase